MPDIAVQAIQDHVKKMSATEALLIQARARRDALRELLTIEDEIHQMVVKLTGTERVAEIQKAVTEEFQISLDELLHGTREERVAWPRQIAIALTREFTSLSMPVIAGLFGKKNHTSVIYAAKAVRKRCETEPAAVRVVNRIRTKIRPPQNCVPPDEAEKLPVAV